MPNKPLSDKPQYRGWAPGNYACKCTECGAGFTGDKRAWMCADCAYTEPVRKLAATCPCPTCADKHPEVCSNGVHYAPVPTPAEVLKALLVATEAVFPRTRVKGQHHITDSPRGVLLNIWVEEAHGTCFQTDLDGLDFANPRPWLEDVKADILARLPKS